MMQLCARCFSGPFSLYCNRLRAIDGSCGWITREVGNEERCGGTVANSYKHKPLAASSDPARLEPWACAPALTVIDTLLGQICSGQQREWPDDHSRCTRQARWPWTPSGAWCLSSMLQVERNLLARLGTASNVTSPRSEWWRPFSKQRSSRPGRLSRLPSLMAEDQFKLHPRTSHRLISGA